MILVIWSNIYDPPHRIKSHTRLLDAKSCLCASSRIECVCLQANTNSKWFLLTLWGTYHFECVLMGELNSEP